MVNIINIHYFISHVQNLHAFSLLQVVSIIFLIVPLKWTVRTGELKKQYERMTFGFNQISIKTTVNFVCNSKIFSNGYICVLMLFYRPINMSFANHFRIHWMLTVGGMLLKPTDSLSVWKIGLLCLWFWCCAQFSICLSIVLFTRPLKMCCLWFLSSRFLPHFILLSNQLGYFATKTGILFLMYCTLFTINRSHYSLSVGHVY